MNKITDHLGRFPKILGDEAVIDQLLTEGDREKFPNILTHRRQLATIFNAAPFLFDCARKNLDWFETAINRQATEVCEHIISCTDKAFRPNIGEAQLRITLRELKSKIALISAIAEISGAAMPSATNQVLSSFADKAIDACLDLLVSNAFAEHGIELDPARRPARQSGLVIVALGKHGGNELNYSSDIDIVALYCPDESALAGHRNLNRIYERMVRILASILQDRDQNGYVFRTDLRLRPDPGSTPVALSIAAALHYYESRGQNWERAAWIKARSCAGCIKVGERFLSELAPFIWRKHLDFATIDDIKTIKRQINVAINSSGRAVHGHDVKLGSGGIREIEFFAQIQQLVAGGRDPHLRARSTCESLRALADSGWIDAGVAASLTAHYWFLRAVENRLQMRHDEQTHSLPLEDAQLEPVVALLPQQNTAQFKIAYRHSLDAVVTHYGALFCDEDTDDELAKLNFVGSKSDPDTVSILAEIGYRDPLEAEKTVKNWHAGGYAATRADKARQTLVSITPALVRMISNTKNADEALRQFDLFVSRLPAGAELFALLQNNPPLQRILIDCIVAAPRMTESILRRVHIVDGLVDPAFYNDIPTAETLDRRAADFLSEARSYEDIIDRVRIFGQEQMFLIGAGIVAGTITAAQAATQFSALAGILLEWVFDAVRSEFEVKHGKIDGAEVALLAFGKLASREMNAQSDLDFILIYDAPKGDDFSSGPKKLAASHYYIRLTQRLIAALGAPTAEGVLYQTDMRLRPSGKAGPLATSLAGFARYQKQQAWTWEHMALSRARVVCGDRNIATRIDLIICEVLAGNFDRKKITNDVIEMRLSLLRDRPAKTVWDIKLADGGLIDLEFIAQYAQLAIGSQLNLPQAPPVRVLKEIAGTNQLGNSGELEQTYHLYNTVLQLMTTCHQDPLDTAKWSSGFVELLTRTTNFPSLALLSHELQSRQKRTTELFTEFVK